VAHVLVLLRRELGEVLAAADLDEEEELPDGRARLPCEARDRRKVVDRVAHHHRVHLNGDPLPAQQPDRVEGRVEVARDAADAVVHAGARTVEADGGDADTEPAQRRDAFLGEERRDARGERERKREAPRAGGELVEVGPHEHVPAGGDEHGPRRPERGQAVEERLGLTGRELARERGGDGRRAAVPARERARSRRLPEDEDRAAVEVHADRVEAGSR